MRTALGHLQLQSELSSGADAYIGTVGYFGAKALGFGRVEEKESGNGWRGSPPTGGFTHP